MSVTIRIERLVSPTPPSWEELSDVVAEDGIHWTRGMASNAPTDCVATPGTLEFSLRNDAGNSGTTAGWYSPDSSSVRSGFGFGQPVRVVINDGTTDFVMWRGRLRTILPAPGIYGVRRSLCTAQDCIGDLAEADVREIVAQVNKTEVQLLQALIAALPTDAQPLATSYDGALDVYPYAFDDLGDGVKGLDAVTRVVGSAQGLLYSKADGTLRYDNRHTKMLRSSSFAFTDSHLKRDDGLSVPNSLANVFNRVRVTTHPRTVDTGTIVVLYASASRVPVGPGQTVDVSGDYADPSARDRVLGGTNFQTPLAPLSSTDYSANTLSDGSGTNITSSVSITATCYASSAKFSITNNGTAIAYVSYQVRGSLIYDNAPVMTESYVAKTYGDRPLDVDLQYQSDANIAKDLADFWKLQYGDLGEQVDDLQFLPLKSSTLLTQALTREIGDVVTVTEPQTGLSVVPAIILGVEATVEAGPWLTWRFIIGPHAPLSMFVFDDATFGLFDAAAAAFGYA